MSARLMKSSANLKGPNPPTLPAKDVEKVAGRTIPVGMDVSGLHFPKVFFKWPSHMTGAPRRLQATQLPEWTCIGNHSAGIVTENTALPMLPIASTGRHARAEIRNWH
jgi:hypothetical protein